MIIGICGNAGVGKDTSADHLVAKHRFRKVSLADPLKRIARDVYAFTEEQLWGPSHMRNAPDYRYVRELHERHDWQDDRDNAKLFRCARCGTSSADDPPRCTVYLTPRFALQSLGTEWGRTCYGDTWVSLAIRTAQDLLATDYGHYTVQQGFWEDVKTGDPTKGVVIPDVRFRNEIDTIHAAGGKVIRLLRPIEGLQGAAGVHASEAEQRALPDPLFDAIVLNIGSIADLAASLDNAILGWQ